MADTKILRLEHPELAHLYENEPDFDILSFDLHDRENLDRLAGLGLGDEGKIELLKTHQRLLRLEPDLGAARRLLDLQLDSAHRVADLPEPTFVRRFEEKGGDAETARRIHARARAVKATAQHLFIGARQLLGEAHFRQTRAFNAAPDVEAELSKVPSYQDLFGGLDYLECTPCQSIFGPAAYFLDLMRVIESYVTEPNDIDPKYRLETRRPDLFDLKLTCDNTDRLVPYLEIVDKVLEARLARETHRDPYQAVAGAPFPFNLPFNLPLGEIRSNLKQLKTSLSEIYQVLLAGDGDAARREVAREFLGLSIEQLEMVARPRTTAEELAPCFGFATTEELDRLSRASVFQERTGLTRAELVALLDQETSVEERPAVAPSFFINDTGEGPDRYMSLKLAANGRDDVYERIEGLTLRRLDRLNRFIRLRGFLGWSCAEVDWAMKSVSATEIAPAILPFAGVERLRRATGLGVAELAGFWSVVKPVGRGQDPLVPIDLFDRVFNNPGLLRGRNPYNPDEHVPFDPKRPSEWKPKGSEPSDNEIRSRLNAALSVSDDDLTRLAGSLDPRHDATIETNLTNLSILYRLAAMARVARMSVAEYLLLLRLLYPGGQSLLTVEDFLLQRDTAAWLDAADWNVYELAYVITGHGHGFVSPGYLKEDIRPLIENMATISTGARLTPQSFVFEGIDGGRSAAVFQELRSKAYVTELGIFKSEGITFEVLAAALPVRNTDLQSDLIDREEAEKAFQLLITHGVILAQAGAVAGPIAKTFGPDTSLDFLFDGKEQAQEMRNQVNVLLDAAKVGVAHSLAVTQDAHRQQNQNVDEGLAGFLGTSVEMIQALAPFIAAPNHLTELLPLLLTPLQAGAPMPVITTSFIAALARFLLLMRKIDLTPAEAKAVIEDQTAFDIDLRQLTLSGVRALMRFKKLTADLHDTDGLLVAWYRMPSHSPEEKEKKLEALHRLTGWPEDQITTLVNRFWSDGGGFSTTDGVARLQAVFALSDATGLDVSSLLDINKLADLPLIVGGEVDPGNWQTYRHEAGITLAAVGAQHDDDSFAGVDKALTGDLVTRKRDALMGYTLFELARTLPEIRTPADLYQYLLIDVEMSGCDRTSYIAQGIASLQLYLQKARLNLEPGIASLPIPDAWWSWLGAYRVWEANRKIFLYPENYIEPSLRRTRTEPFQALSEALLQNDVNDAAVGEAYSGYMDEFAILANLRIVSSCRYNVPDPQTGAHTDTVFLFGRTNTQPNVYYYRQCRHYSVSTDPTPRTWAEWTPWEKIDLTIGSPYVTPVYAFGKLMIFWAEILKSTSSATEGKESVNYTAYTAHLKYSFIDLRGRWVQPQTYEESSIIDVVPDDYVSSSPFSEFYDPEDPRNLYWHKVYVAHVNPGSWSGAAPFDNGEQILVFFGPAPAFFAGLEPSMKKPSASNFPKKEQLDKEVYDNSQRLKAFLDAGMGALGGYSPSKPIGILSSSLLKQFQFVALLDGTPGPRRSDRLYMTAIVYGQLQIWAMEIRNLIFADYYCDRDFSPANTFGRESGQEPPGADTYPDLLSNLAPVNTALTTVKNQPGWFVFDNGDDVFLGAPRITLRKLDETLMLSTELPDPLQGIAAARNRPYTESLPPIEKTHFAFTRLGTHTAQELSRKLFTGGIDELLTLSSQSTPELPFSRFEPSDQVIDTTTDKLDFNGAYGPYFWEIFFHAVFLVAETLRSGRRFEQARRWYEYIFNPTVRDDGEPGHPNDVYWRFLPFRGRTWEALVDLLTDVGQIAVYNDDPFDPHAIARLRPSAYPKAVVMRYIDNLLEWGDALFAANTRESINQATLLYVLAADLLGPRPQDVGRFEQPVPRSYNDIRAAYDTSGTAQRGGGSFLILANSASPISRFYHGLTLKLTGGPGEGQTRTVVDYDGPARKAIVDPPWHTTPASGTTYQISGIPQFLIDAENFRIGQPAKEGAVLFSEAPFNAIDAYFGIPENSELAGYWDRVEDRLFKIRHCQSLAGVERVLALFAPPINPRALVQAAASGGVPLAVSDQTDQTAPFYRFPVVLEKAKGLTAMVTGLGGALLAALEKADAEELALLRSTQERQVLDLITRVHESRIEEIASQRQALEASLASARTRRDHYRKLLDDGLSSGEAANLDAMATALAFNLLASIGRTASSIAYTIPQVGSPFAMTYGGVQIGSALAGASQVFEIGSMISSFVAERSLTMAGYDRRDQEWELQTDLAQRDVEQIEAQLAGNDFAAATAAQELTVHLKQIAQSSEFEAFLKRKFTSQELYKWLAGRLSQVYFQTYRLAFGMAMVAQRAYQYELLAQDTFINFGYWDTLRKGLGAGEGLMLGLHQLESAYLARSDRDLEIQKTISLRQLDPVALLDLQRTGQCDFALTERLFDQDFPGHYARKIKTVSISIPALVGPYENVKATLIQTRNQIALTPDPATVRFLLGIDKGAAPSADRLRTDWWVNQQIALSSGVDDSGLFQLNFQDERYLPFEGTGAVSNWRLSMPRAANRIDYAALSDVVIRLSYSARYSSSLRDAVVKMKPVKDWDGNRFFTAAQQWPQSWYAFTSDRSDPTKQTLAMPFAGIRLAPPQVELDAVGAVLLYLEVASGKADGSYLEIRFPGEAPIAVKIEDNKGRVERRITSWKGDWQLVFDLSKAPATIKKDGYISPEKLLNVGIIVAYKAELNWD